MLFLFTLLAASLVCNFVVESIFASSSFSSSLSSCTSLLTEDSVTLARGRNLFLSFGRNFEICGFRLILSPVGLLGASGRRGRGGAAGLFAVANSNASGVDAAAAFGREGG